MQKKIVNQNEYSNIPAREFADKIAFEFKFRIANLICPCRLMNAVITRIHGVTSS